jgi:hypothetical protein
MCTMGVALQVTVQHLLVFSLTLTCFVCMTFTYVSLTNEDKPSVFARPP